jgi:hypothetical protein
MRAEIDLECLRREMVGMTTSARYGLLWNRVDILWIAKGAISYIRHPSSLPHRLEAGHGDDADAAMHANCE